MALYKQLELVIKIPLTQGQETLIDFYDWFEVGKYKWHAQWNRCTRSFYASKRIKHPIIKDCQTALDLQRFIMGLKHGDKRQVDHINHNTLDNRRCNLRIVSRRGNHENRKHQSIYGTSVYKLAGNRKRPYVAKVKVNKKDIYLGQFCTPIEAQKARENFIINLNKTEV